MGRVIEVIERHCRWFAIHIHTVIQTQYPRHIWRWN